MVDIMATILAILLAVTAGYLVLGVIFTFFFSGAEGAKLENILKWPWILFGNKG